VSYYIIYRTCGCDCNVDIFYNICYELYYKEIFVCYNIMNVNIFGSSETFCNVAKSHYIDQKFTTLSRNSTSKVNKSCDTLVGDLTLLLNDGAIRTFEVSDLSRGKGVSLLIGDQNNQIQYSHEHTMKKAPVYGTRFTCPNGDICRMGADNDVRTHCCQVVVRNNE